MLLGYVPPDQLPVLAGQEVVIPRGTRIRSTHPRVHGDTFAKRTYRVRADHTISGMDRREDAYAIRKGFNLFENTKVRWAGTGGYWSEADINHVILPGHTEPLAREGTLREMIVERTPAHGLTLLFCEGDILAGFDALDHRAFFSFYPEEAIRDAQADFMERHMGSRDLSKPRVSSLTDTGITTWIMDFLFRPARQSV